MDDNANKDDNATGGPPTNNYPTTSAPESTAMGGPATNDYPASSAVSYLLLNAVNDAVANAEPQAQAAKFSDDLNAKVHALIIELMKCQAARTQLAQHALALDLREGQVLKELNDIQATAVSYAAFSPLALVLTDCRQPSLTTSTRYLSTTPPPTWPSPLLMLSINLRALWVSLLQPDRSIVAVALHQTAPVPSV